MAATFRCRFCLTLVVCTLVSAPATAQQPGKVYALLVADSNDKKIGVGGIEDSKAMMNALLTGLGDKRLDPPATLTGNEVSREAILRHFAGLNVGPEDVLLFHFSGHGGMQFKPKREHYLQLNGDIMARSELRRAMQEKNPALVVILTDCCSSTIPDAERRHIPGKKWGPPARPGLDHVEPGFARLLFHTRGLVDITAADDGTSAIGSSAGGAFTRALHDVLLADKNLNRKDLTWEDFYPQLKDQTSKVYLTYNEPGEFVQTSRAFSLPGSTWGFLATQEKESDPVLISEIYLDMPAERAGLQRGDVLLEVEGRAVRTLKDALAEFGTRRKSQSIRLTVQRNGDRTPVVLNRS
jgi:hypothetical protein